MVKPPRKVRHGEDVLSEVRAVTIRLANGRTATFSMVDEITIPPGLFGEALAEESRKSVARLGFWSVQVERMLAAVRNAESVLLREEGRVGLMARKYIDENTERDSTEFGLVSDTVKKDSVLFDMRAQLNVLRTNYGLVKSIRDAVWHRTELLIRRIGRSAG